MTTVRKVARVHRRDATQHLGKAISFIEAAEAELESGRADAATLCAIHAAIAAADSVTVALAGQRSTDPDHQRAVTLLRSVASASVEIGQKADQLLALLRQKNEVEYEARRARVSEARRAVTQARRLVDWAKTQVSAAGL